MISRYFSNIRAEKEITGQAVKVFTLFVIALAVVIFAANMKPASA